MAYSIDYINQICIDLGGTGGHKYDIDALNEICGLLGATAGHDYEIHALNAICTALGYTAGWRYEIEALNAICTGGGGTGGHQYEIHAWQEIQTGSLLNYDPLKDTDLSLYINLRSGNTLVDTKGNNTTILTPAVYLSGTTSYIRHTGTMGIVGGAAWDVIFKFRLDDKSRRDPLFYNGGNTNTSKGITIMPYNGNLIIYSSDGTAYATATLNCNFQSLTNYTLRFQWDGSTGGTMTVTVNGTVYTTTTNKGWSGDAIANVDFGAYAGSFYFKGIYSSVVGTLGGVSFNFNPTYINGSDIYETSVPGRYLLLKIFNGALNNYGQSTYFLDKGFSIQSKKTDGTLLYFPNDANGDYVNMNNYVTGGTNLVSVTNGLTTKHNLWKSKIRFQNAFFDRSNATIWTDACRASSFYDSGNTKDFDISELNALTLMSYLNDGYRGKFYLKFTGNSIDDRTSMDELLLCTTDRKGTIEQLPIYKYTNDVKRLQKYINGSYYVDSDGYLQLYEYDDLGGDPDENYAYFQSLLDAGLSVNFSGKEYEVYALQQPLIPQNSTALNISCELRAKKATIVNITQNVSINDTVYHVDSVTNFHSGEWVAISDDLQSTQGGSSQTRKVASCGKIISIDADNLTITLDAGSKYAITAASNAKLGHNQSVILAESKTGININGTGIINGNWTNQYDVEPVNSSAEEIRMGCGICFKSSDNNIVNGSLMIKGGSLHGITLWDSDDCEITGIEASENHDKGILLAATDATIISNVKCENQEFEDGITVYLNNTNFTLNNITFNGNPRGGLYIVNNPNANGVVSNVNSSDSISVYSENIELSNISLTGNAYFYISDTYNQANNIIINNLTFTDVTISTILTILGAVSDVTFNEMIMDGCNGTGIYATKQSGGTLYPSNILFDGGGIYDHTGTKTDINASADVTFTDFDGLP